MIFDWTCIVTLYISLGLFAFQLIDFISLLFLFPVSFPFSLFLFPFCFTPFQNFSFDIPEKVGVWLTVWRLLIYGDIVLSLCEMYGEGLYTDFSATAIAIFLWSHKKPTSLVSPFHRYLLLCARVGTVVHFSQMLFSDITFQDLQTLCRHHFSRLAFEKDVPTMSVHSDF